MYYTYTREQFIKKVIPYAINDYKKSGILASLSIAQAVLESGNGNSKLARECNNLFGIKWTPNCGYDYKIYYTKEQTSTGKEYTIQAKFRKYKSYQESFDDHSNFLKGKSRYNDTVNAKDYKAACKAISISGYCTAINYNEKLISIIETHKLYQYDKINNNNINYDGSDNKMQNTNKKLQSTSNVKVIYNQISSNKYGSKCPYCMTPEYITIHNTANNASARSEVSYMQNNNSSTSFHIAVDDKECIIALPLDRNAWHCGDGNGNGNRKSIGVEICYSTSTDSNKFRKCELNAIEIVKQLMKLYDIPIQNVQPHKYWSRKNCPHRTDINWFKSQLTKEVCDNNSNSDSNIDKQLFDAVSKIIKVGKINLDFNSWKRRDLINPRNVKYLLPRLGGIDKLIKDGIILDRTLWIININKVTADNIASLLIKYASKL